MNLKKISVVMLILCFGFSSLGVQAFAVNIGEELSEPEIGWKRYNYDNALIQYGTGYTTFSQGYYKTGAANIEFKFTGNKLRLIAWTNENTYTDNMEVFIDGTSVGSYTYDYAGTRRYNALVFQYTGLSNTTHHVKLVNNQPGKFWSLQSIDIDEDGELIDMNTPIGPETPTNVTAIASESKVDISWDPVADADSYNVKRATTSGGLYTTVSQEVYGTSYTDNSVVNGNTYYYVVTAVNTGGESNNSNEASATPEAPSLERALLRITMTNGQINEYDVSMNKVIDFTGWYDDRANGNGKAYFIIDRTFNLGPFTSRKDYIIFEKVLQFEVMEYTETE